VGVVGLICLRRFAYVVALVLLFDGFALLWVDVDLS
jgi:hypothetical protein